MRILITLLMVLVAFPVGAETVQISASEKAGATRIVLDFKKRPTWSMQRKGVGYRFQFSSISPLRFDLSRLFQAIDRSRVSDVRALGNNALEIDLACRCALIPNDVGETSILFDVVDVIMQQPEVQTQPPSLSMPDSGETTTGISVAPQNGKVDLKSPLPLGSAVLSPAPTPVALDILGSAFELHQSPDARDGAAVNMMARALARAISQGLVDANPGSLTGDTRGFSDGLANLSGSGNLSVVTGFDSVIPSDLEEVGPVPSGKACLANRHADVASWGEINDHTTLGSLRSESIAEDGRVTPEGATALARYYIFLGFGSEARRTSSFMTPSTDLDVILALADIMDRGSSNAEILEDQVSCAGAISLWALLASPIDQADAPESTNDLLTAFSGLPAHLRVHLGPLLSERLHDLGLQEQARTAINAATRGGNRSEESKLARARLDLGGTHAPDARNTLTNLANSTSVTAAGALLELLKDAEARDMAPNPSWVEDAPTLVAALEGTEIAERLNLAGLKGLIALGRYDDFRQAISRDSPGVTDTRRRSLGIEALSSALHKGDDAQFLKTEIALSDLVKPQDLGRRARVDVAERFVDLGLPERAKDYVFDEPATREELRVTARVLTDLGAEQAALELVRRTELNDAKDILAETFVAAGDDDAAIAAFESAGDLRQARAAAIRTGSWDWVAENGEDDVAFAAATLRGRDEALKTAEPGTNGALILESRERRARILDLLANTAPQVDGADFTN
ncbi:MAG: hypothetical protein AAFX07_09835 [Pseudomonadota bacterium]